MVQKGGEALQYIGSTMWKALKAKAEGSICNSVAIVSIVLEQEQVIKITANNY